MSIWTRNDTHRVVAAAAASVTLFAGGIISSSADATASAAPTTVTFVEARTSDRPAASKPSRSKARQPVSKAVRGQVFTPTAKPAAKPTVRMVIPPRVKQVTRGIKPSAYTGKHYNPKFELVRRCIVKRESEGQYDVRYPDRTVSTAAGAYQFIISTSNHVAKLINRPDLIGVPASQWDRETQDRGFWRLWDNGKGKHHWAGGRWDCWNIQR